jgi:Transposase zinc-ribbon domain
MVTGNEWTWPTSLLDVVRFFSDLDNCQNVLVSLRWPDGVTCPTCGSKEHSYLKTRRPWKCKNKHPQQMFSIKKSSIFGVLLPAIIASPRRGERAQRDQFVALDTLTLPPGEAVNKYCHQRAITSRPPPPSFAPLPRKSSAPVRLDR